MLLYQRSPNLAPILHSEFLYAQQSPACVLHEGEQIRGSVTAANLDILVKHTAPLYERPYQLR